MLVDASHSQLNRLSGSEEILLQYRFTGVAQVAELHVTLRRKPGSQESSQSQSRELS